MSSILERSSDILSWLGAHPEQLFSVHDIATACKLAPSTCTRILKELLALGWVDQRSRRQGYRLGPRAYALTTAQAYRSSLVESCYPVAQELADQLQQIIVVSIRRGLLRQSLFECAPFTGTISGSRLKEHEELYRSGAGRLFLAMAKKSVQNRLISELGLPTKQAWPGMLTRNELDAELRQIKKQGWLRADFKTGHSSIVAAFQDGAGSHACIGFHARSSWIRTEHYDIVRQAAASIQA